MAKFSVGTLIKKVFNAAGEVSNETNIILPKTLAKLVFMSSGESVEHAMEVHCKEINELTNTVENMTVSMKTYDSMEEYKQALADGTALPQCLYIVNLSDSNDLIDE